MTGMKTFKRLQEPYYQGSAAELGFFFLLAVVPVLSLFLQIMNRLSATRALCDHLMDQFGSYSIVSSIVQALQSGHSGKISILFLILAVWSASKLEFSMIRIANYTYQCSGENGFIGYFKARFRAISTLVLLILIVMISMVALVYFSMVINSANTALGGNAMIYTHRVIALIRWPILLVLYWLFLAVNYMMTPNETLSLKEVLPGSLFAAGGILVSTIVYYIYFEYFSHLNLVYGSLAAVVALLLWFYLLGFILVIGMIVNASWFGRGEDRY